MTRKRKRPAGQGRARRPHSDAAQGQPYPVDPTVLGEQVRRRRAASWRLPPLEDGRRDPLDVPPVPGESTDPWHRAERLEPLWQLARELLGLPS